MYATCGGKVSALISSQVAGLSHFAIQHTCRYWESLTSVAVHYNVDVSAIRVLNNLISEHSLRSRQYVFVPGDYSAA